MVIQYLYQKTIFAHYKKSFYLSQNQTTMSNEPESLRIDYDGKWKRLIEQQPRYFIEFFLPKIYPLIDFKFPPKFLNQDIQKIAVTARKKDDLITDIIMEVRLKSGKSRLLYIHIEVDSYGNQDFGEKMFRYFYRIWDKYKKDVTAFALFVGESVPQTHNFFEYEFGATKIRYDFPSYIAKNQNQVELKKSKNPFAIAILACIFIIQTRKDLENRLKLKLELTNFILNTYQGQNFESETIVSIAEFVMSLLILPKKLEHTFKTKFYPAMENSKVIMTGTLLELFNEFCINKFGETMADREKRIEKKVQLELKKQREDIQRDRQNAILNVHKKLHLDAKSIADLLGFNLKFVEKTIKEAKKKEPKDKK